MYAVNLHPVCTHLLYDDVTSLFFFLPVCCQAQQSTASHLLLPHLQCNVQAKKKLCIEQYLCCCFNAGQFN